MSLRTFLAEEGLALENFLTGGVHAAEAAALKVEHAAIAAIQDLPGFIQNATNTFNSVGLTVPHLKTIFATVQKVEADVGSKQKGLAKAQLVVDDLNTLTGSDALPSAATAVIGQIVTTAKSVLDATEVLKALQESLAGKPAEATPAPVSSPVQAEAPVSAGDA